MSMILQHAPDVECTSVDQCIGKHYTSFINGNLSMDKMYIIANTSHRLYITCLLHCLALPTAKPHIYHNTVAMETTCIHSNSQGR